MANDDQLLVPNEGRQQWQFDAQPPGFAVDKIIGGTEAQPNSIPWQARITLTIPDPHKVSCPRVPYQVVTCGASIVSPIHILTSAMCVQYPTYSTCNEIFPGNPDGVEDFLPENAVVIVGDHSISDTTEIGEKTHQVACILKHPSWNLFESISGGSLDVTNNIAVITLKEPIDLESAGSKAKPVCLATKDIEKQNIINTTERPSLTVSGWGQVAGGYEDLRSDKLMVAEVPYLGVDRETCFKKFPPTFPYDSSMMCTGNVHSDNQPDELAPYRTGACNGDWGGKKPCLCTIMIF